VGIEIVKHPNPFRKDTLLLIFGIQRLLPEIHERLIERLRYECPFDYAIVDLHKPEYDEILSYDKKWWGRIQIFKLWDILQQVPEQYKFIIRGRNDVRFRYTRNSHLTRKEETSQYRRLGIQLRELMDAIYVEPKFLKHKYVLFVGNTVEKGHILKSLEHQTFKTLPDLMICFHRDEMINPWGRVPLTPSKELLDLKENHPQRWAKSKEVQVHYFWHKMFNCRCCAFQSHIDIIRSGETIDEYVVP